MYVRAQHHAMRVKQRTAAGTGVDMVSFFRSRNPDTKRADSRLTPAKHVVSTVHGTRTVLLDSRSGHYYGLDEVGSRIWNLARAGGDVDSFIAELRHSRLLEEG
jgi:hypothetical protein